MPKFKTVKVSISSLNNDGVISQQSIDEARRLIGDKIARSLTTELLNAVMFGAIERITPEITDIIAEYRVITDDS